MDLTAALSSARRAQEQAEKELAYLQREQQQRHDVSDPGGRDDVRQLREQLNSKSDELEGLQEKMRHLIQEWEKQAVVSWASVLYRICISSKHTS